MLNYSTDILSSHAPDAILMPGDIFERIDGSNKQGNTAGFELIRFCSELAPVYFSVGNHENGGTGSWNFIKWRKSFLIPKYYDPAELDRIFDCGAVFLDNGFAIEDGKVFAVLKDKKARMSQRLYEIEEIFASDFLKINQSCLIILQSSL